MGFLDSLFKRSAAPELPGLEALLGAEGIATVPESLAAHREEFEHLHEPAERAAWAKAAASLLNQGVALPPRYEDLHDRLRPVLVPAWQAEREGFWKRRFMDGLTLRLEVDGAPVPAEWLQIWGRGEDEVVEFALDALRKDLEKPWERMPSGIYRSPWKDGRDAARLLLPESYRALFPNQTTFLAAPHGGVLYAAPQPLLPRLVDAISGALGQGPMVMAAMLQRVDDKLVPARLQDPHPMSGPQRELKQLDLLEAMKAQAQDLDPALGTAASAGLLRTKERTFTVATWPEQEAPVLLPEVDLLLMVNRQGQPLGLYARTSLPRISRLRPQAVDIWGPRRLKFTGFPTAEELGLLDCAANAEQAMALLGLKQAPAAAPAAPAPAGAKSLLSTQPVPTLPRHLQGQVGKQDED
jgi:hypothetical protein